MIYAQWKELCQKEMDSQMCLPSIFKRVGFFLFPTIKNVVLASGEVHVPRWLYAVNQLLF